MERLPKQNKRILLVDKEKEAQVREILQGKGWQAILYPS
jgi:hypothetical protein